MEKPANEPDHVSDRFVVTFSKHTRDSFAMQTEAFCKASGLRYRMQEDRGAAASLFVIHLRGPQAEIERVKAKVQQLVATELLFVPQRRQLSRGAVSTLSFLIGLLLIGGLFFLAS